MSKDTYLLLYKLAKGSKPYQPSATWCANAQYKNSELLHPKIKLNFMPDEILHTTGEFIRNNLASPQGLEP